MSKFYVCVTRYITESAMVVIEADSEEEAEQEAYEQRYDLEYETDDNAPSDYDINVELWEE